MSLIEEALRRLQDPPIPTDGSSGARTRPRVKPPAVMSEGSPGMPAPHPWPTGLAGPGTSLAGYPMTLLVVTLVIVVLVLGVALFLGGVWWFGRTLSQIPSPPSARLLASTALNTPPQTITEPPAAAPPSTAAEAPPSEPVTPQGEAPIDAQGKAAPEAHPEASYMISGIVEGVGESYAVINGAVSAIGDRVGDFTVVEIGKGLARLRRDDGQELTLRVPR